MNTLLVGRDERVNKTVIYEPRDYRIFSNKGGCQWRGPEGRPALPPSHQGVLTFFVLLLRQSKLGARCLRRLTIRIHFNHDD